MKLFPKLFFAFGIAATVVAAVGLAVVAAAGDAAASLAAGAEAGAAVDRVRVLGWALVAIPFGLALALGVLIARTLGRRLGRIAAGVEAVGAGDLDARIGDTSSDEVGDLARAFDATAAALGRSTVSRAHLDAVIESIPDPLAVVDGDGRLVRVNQAGADLIGREADEVVGEPVFSLFVPEADEVARFGAAIAGAPSFTGLETRFQRADGATLPVRLSAAKLPSHDSARSGLVVVAQDISATHAAHRALVAARDQAERANRAKSDFLASMSHEIRTPLNGVIGMTDHLLRSDLGDDQREVAGVIRSSGQALLDVVNDVLDFSKIEAGLLELEAAPFGVQACLGGACDVVAYRAEQKGLALRCDIDPALPSHVVGDGTRLRQVVLNLLANAVKFTEAGTVTLAAEPCDPAALPEALRPDGPCERGLHVRVSDTGIGIRADALDGLFDPFTQADASTTRRYGGTGLGLAISKQLVDAMGGRLWAESEVGAGSTFHVIVPAEPAPAAPPGPPDLSPPADMPSPRHPDAPHVLVAEDNAVNRRVVGLMLGRLGIDPVIVEDGDAVLPALRRAEADGQPFDVAFLDVRMPRVGGVEAAQAIRADDALRQPMLVALTADVTHEQREACLAAGMDAFLTKPLAPDALASVLASVARATPERDGTPPADADFPTLDRLTAGDPEVRTELLVQAREELGDGLAVLKEALRNEDLRTTALTAHSLRSVADVLDDTPLADACADTEDAADAGRLVEAVRAFLPLHAHAHAAIARLDAALPASLDAEAAMA
ncbi:ATP-binding protein [Rubrivirga sp. IMCC45206]|uniref:hybrid sensor histidine kinase/response regulator n=1 Tax=Rubrivirga sp. IMCC45206 TaxID=3391614 RepID=UPI00398FEF63